MNFPKGYRPLGNRAYTSDPKRHYHSRRVYSTIDAIPPVPPPSPEMTNIQQPTKRKVTPDISTRPKKYSKIRQHDIFDQVGNGRKRLHINLVSPAAQAVEQAKAMISLKRKCRKKVCKLIGQNSIKGSRRRKRTTRKRKSKWKQQRRRRKN